ncbi:hypothetical protein GW626_18450 [Peribacillus muralis]|uniref:hypothetical protein n=1 Tax=Peribacillus muralis TaxID=264697 RepID=UPI001F4E9D61|nr:hypothetical protein [Peribacillus muralis]MCK1992337.1 hypothetical protein [Peribacillus muralis]MCK2012893.1 hypothetical protein [Peribacillus muralis]
MNIDIGFLFLVLLSLTALIFSIRYTKEQDKEQSQAISGAGVFGNMVYLLITLLPFKVRKAIYIMVCLLMVLLFSIGLWELL